MYEVLYYVFYLYCIILCNYVIICIMYFGINLFVFIIYLYYLFVFMIDSWVAYLIIYDNLFLINKTTKQAHSLTAIPSDVIKKITKYKLLEYKV